MSDKTQWTHPQKKGDDQSTTFTQVKYPETAGERDFPQIVTSQAQRGEQNFAKFPTAR